MGFRGRRGFTLVELLVVIVIISLIAALLLPAIMKALCTARQGTAASMISQLAQACKMYEQDFAVYPPGKGDGSKDMADILSKPGAKKQAYFEFSDDMRVPGSKHVVNPVWDADGDPPSNIIFYRNNAVNNKPGSGPPPAGGGAGGMPVLKKTSFDMWCAGCDFAGGRPESAWSVRYE